MITINFTGREYNKIWYVIKNKYEAILAQEKTSIEEGDPDGALNAFSLIAKISPFLISGVEILLEVSRSPTVDVEIGVKEECCTLIYSILFEKLVNIWCGKENLGEKEILENVVKKIGEKINEEGIFEEND